MSRTLAVHPLWLLAPSLVMSSLCLVCWWRSPGLAEYLLLLATPCVALALWVELLRKAGMLSIHPFVLVLANVASVAALMAFVAAWDSEIVKEHPASGLVGNPTSPYDTLPGVVMILAVGSVAFVLPGLLVGVVGAWRRRGGAGDDARAT